jgi:glycerol uptake operon antiterminator
MHNGSSGSLLNLSGVGRGIPIVENRVQGTRVFDLRHVRAVSLRHCNLFEFTGFLERARQRNLPTYVNTDHMDGIYADTAGLRYLKERLHVTGIVSSHPRVLAMGKGFGLETIQRIFALDSTGLETSLASVDTTTVDMLDISPALVVPHIIARIRPLLPLPFIASGLLHSMEQIQEVLQAGATGVFIAREELWNAC